MGKTEKEKQAEVNAYLRSQETPEQTIARLEREKQATKSEHQGLIGIIVLSGIFLLLTQGFGCQIGAPYERY